MSQERERERNTIERKSMKKSTKRRAQRVHYKLRKNSWAIRKSTIYAEMKNATVKRISCIQIIIRNQKLPEAVTGVLISRRTLSAFLANYWKFAQGIIARARSGRSDESLRCCRRH